MSRLTIEQVEKLPTKRIISYLRTIKHKRYTYICDCCGEPLWDLYSPTKEERQKQIDEYNETCQYIQDVYNVLNKRKDRKPIESDNLNKAQKSKNSQKRKGCQKKTKSKKKVIKDSLHWSSKGSESQNAKKKSAKHSISKDIDKMSYVDVFRATGFSPVDLKGGKL